LNKKKLIIGIILLGYATIPAIAPENIVHLMTITGVWIIIASGLNLLTGYMGYVSFGNAAFVGIGAYISAILAQRLGVSFWVGLAVAPILTALFGLLLGVAILRLSGIYFSIGTLILGEIFYSIYYNWSPVTGGFMGLNVPRAGIIIPGLYDLEFELIHWYYFIHFMVLLVVGGIALLVKSQFGKELIAIRENESLAESLGVNVNARKSQCFALTCLFAGLGGVLYGFYLGHIDPGSFAMAGSTEFITIIIIGGLASLVGPFFGAYLLITLSLYLEVLGNWRMVAYGLIIVLVMLYLRGGIAGLLKTILSRTVSDDLT
jgi:branched-chain amino acid transport system permease protein